MNPSPLIPCPIPPDSYWLPKLMGEGVLPGPFKGAIWDFSSGEPVYKGRATPITFSRASQATYWDADGNLQIAGIDALRIDYDPATGECLGSLWEGQSTNLWPYSEPSSGSEVTAVGPGITYSDAPSRGFQSWINLIGDGSPKYYRLFPNYNVTGTTNLTLSNFSKLDNGEAPVIGSSGSGSEADVTIMIGGASTSDGSAVLDVGGGLFAIWKNATVGTAYPASHQFQKYGAFSERTVTSTGNQLELGGRSSYIPTYGSATIRADDVGNVNDMSWFNPSHGVFIAKVKAYPGRGPADGFVFQFGTGDDRINIASAAGSNTRLQGRVGNASSAPNTNAFSQTEWEYVALSYNANGDCYFARRTGNTAAAVSSGLGSYSGAMPSSMRIGNALNAHLPWLRYEPPLITSGSELEAILNALPPILLPVISGLARPGNTLTSTHDLPWLINGTPIWTPGGDPVTGKEITLGYEVWGEDYADIGIHPGDVITQAESNELVVVDYDTDTAGIITAVGASEFGDDLEAQRASNRWRFDDFVLGCKADPSPNSGVSNFAAMKLWRLAAPNTLAGFSKCGVGPDPTWTNVVSGDYDRLGGVKGNGTSKYGSTNRAGNADPSSNRHIAVWQSAIPDYSGGTVRASLTSKAFEGAMSALMESFQSRFHRLAAGGGTIEIIDYTRVPGLYASSRNDTLSVTCYYNGSSSPLAQNDGIPGGSDFMLFTRISDVGVPQLFSDARIAFYSIGEAIDLEALDARLTTYFTSVI